MFSVFNSLSCYPSFSKKNKQDKLKIVKNKNKTLIKYGKLKIFLEADESEIEIVDLTIDSSSDNSSKK